MRVIILLLFTSSGLYCQFDHLVFERTSKSKKRGNTYRIYAELKNEADQLMVVFGDKEHPLRLFSDQKFFQLPEGSASASEIPPQKREQALQLDSWITISSDEISHPSLQFMGMNVTRFESEGGEISSGVDGAWYILPTAKQSISGKNKRILLAQLTTKGNISGVLNLMGKTHAGEKWIEYNIPLEIK